MARNRRRHGASKQRAGPRGNAVAKPDPTSVMASPHPPQRSVLQRLRRRWKLILLVVVAILGVATGVIEGVLPAIAEHQLLAVGEAAPQVQLTDIDGRAGDPNAASRAQEVMLIFFAGDCSDCVISGPTMCHAAAAHPSVRVMAIDAFGHSRADVITYRSGVPGGCAAVSFFADPPETAAHLFHVLQVPTVYLVRDGRILAAFTGDNAIGRAAAALPAA